MQINESFNYAFRLYYVDRNLSEKINDKYVQIKCSKKQVTLTRNISIMD